MNTRFQLFISSTTSLKEERKGLHQRFSADYEVYLAELDKNPTSPPNAHLRRKIKESDVFILLLGPDFGSVVSKKDPRSVVEWELDHARRLRLNSWGFEQNMARQSGDERQRKLILAVTAFDQVWRNFYTDPEELLSLVKDCLDAWHRDFHAKKSSRFGQLFERAEVVFAIIVILAAVALLGLLLMPGIPPRLMLTQTLLFLAPILAAVIFLTKD